MAEIGFYHLTRTGVIAALPALLGRTIAQGERALVLCGSEQQVAAIDDALWVCAAPDWLPHGTAGSPHPQWQPVFITAQEINPARARYLFLVFGAEAADLAAYARVFDLFDGTDEAAVAAARRRWQAAKAAGHGITYWKQGKTGWDKSA